MGFLLKPWVVALILLALLVPAFAPVMDGFFVLDDFAIVATCRLLGNPLVPFVSDHFPGSFAYRPIPIAFWWASVELFGQDPRPQFILNLLLHVVATLALWRLLVVLVERPWPALLAALLFALHPVPFGTALWPSNRFDLFCTTFGLLAWTASINYRRQGGRSWLVGIHLLLLASLLSKETGLAFVAPIGVALAWPSSRAEPLLSPPRRALLGLLAMVVTWYAWRSYLLGDVGEYMHLTRMPLWQLIATGIDSWLHGVPDLVLLGNHFGRPGVAIASAMVLVFMMIVGIGVFRGHHAGPSPLPVLLMAMPLVFAPALLQSPVMLIRLANGPESLAMLTVFESRFYYTSFAGICVLFALGLRLLGGWLRPALISRRIFPAIVAAGCMLPLALASRNLAMRYGVESQEVAEPAKAAVRALAAMSLPRQHCQVYLLGLARGSRESFSNPYVDSYVKALAPDLGKLAHCLLQTESTPWFHVVPRGSSPRLDYSPMVRVNNATFVSPATGDFPIMAVGGLEVILLNLKPGTRASQLGHAFFLRYQDGEFVDVTRQVRAGGIQVDFVCAREPFQC